jgi:hypothetical protein
MIDAPGHGLVSGCREGQPRGTRTAWISASSLSDSFDRPDFGAVGESRPAPAPDPTRSPAAPRSAAQAPRLPRSPAHRSPDRGLAPHRPPQLCSTSPDAGSPRHPALPTPMLPSPSAVPARTHHIQGASCSAAVLGERNGPVAEPVPDRQFSRAVSDVDHVADQEVLVDPLGVGHAQVDAAV